MSLLCKPAMINGRMSAVISGLLHGITDGTMPVCKPGAFSKFCKSTLDDCLAVDIFTQAHHHLHCCMTCQHRFTIADIATHTYHLAIDRL